MPGAARFEASAAPATPVPAMNLRREILKADARDLVIVILPWLPLEKCGALMRIF
jgi:hypothetical protein